MRNMNFLVASAALLASTQAHMFITSPSPIPGTDSKSPLDPSGSQFPCQGAVLPSTGGQSMAAGAEQKLAFDLGGGDNTAVHGGGSCQISITYETDAAKQKDPANWKVIYSIEGGCPTDASGNLDAGKVVNCSPDSTDTACVNEFPFTIPKGVKDGHAIMAWTWFNNIGNREMYMNCINVDFTGGDGSEMESFPGLFVANQRGIGECPTTERYNVQFPNPGRYVTTKTAGGPFPLAVPTGPGCSAKISGDSPSSPPSKDDPLANQAYSPAQTSVDPVPTSTTSTTSAMSTTSAASTTAGTSSTPAASSTSTTATLPLATPGTCFMGGTVPCPVPGELICVDADQFGLCNIDFCAVSQAVAPGTQCTNGQISRKKIKRGQHPAHHHRGHGHMHGR